jgi:hypothetical protein
LRYFLKAKELHHYLIVFHFGSHKPGCIDDFHAWNALGRSYATMMSLQLAAGLVSLFNQQITGVEGIYNPLS